MLFVFYIMPQNSGLTLDLSTDEKVIDAAYDNLNVLGD